MAEDHLPYIQKVNTSWYLKCNCGMDRKVVNKPTAEKAKKAHWILNFINPEVKE